MSDEPTSAITLEYMPGLRVPPALMEAMPFRQFQLEGPWRRRTTSRRWAASDSRTSVFPLCRTSRRHPPIYGGSCNCDGTKSCPGMGEVLEQEQRVSPEPLRDWSKKDGVKDEETIIEAVGQILQPAMGI